ncbi:MAG: hypothetical protein AMJ79_07135 [Phycisphaerae bacterium SM23_30]|nr:MAG: hypothetical protein AMJ79_07135 [Phycisphaerae bacterium SM23_30]
MNRQGLTILELLVTLVVMTLIPLAVLSILDHTRTQSMMITEEMTRQGSIQHCLNMMVDDITAAATKNSKIEIDNHTLSDGRETAHLTIYTYTRPDQQDPDVQVDWVAVPRFGQNDLVLFRRERSTTSPSDLFIPLCENICSFQVVRLDPEGQASLDSDLPLLEIYARIYRFGPPDPQRVFIAHRTFCSQRFIGARPIETQR